MGDFEELKSAIEAEFPGWLVWRSDAGRWYATRSGDLTDAQLQAGYAMTVASDDADGLRELLLDQASRDIDGDIDRDIDRGPDVA